MSHSRSHRHRHHRRIWRKPGFYVLIVTALFCLFGALWLIRFNIIPSLLLSIIFEAVILLLILIWYLLIKRHRRWMHITGYILAAVLCISNGLIGYTLQMTYSTLDTMASVESQTGSYVDLDVSADSLIESADDLNGRSIGVLKNMDASQKQLMTDWLDSQNIDYTLKEYDSSLLMARNLKGAAIDAIIIYQPYLSLIEEYEELDHFSQGLRTIHQIACDPISMEQPDAVNVTENPFNILVSGIDSYGNISGNGRSDVNMLISVNPTTRSILLISIPRDYYVDVQCENAPGCTPDAKDKLTHTGIYGISVTEKTLEKLFDTTINYAVRVNFSSVIGIIDALGGVEVNNVDDFTIGNYEFKPGIIPMDGEMALAFSRERYAFEQGDRERGRNQMRVVEGIIHKALSPSILNGYSRILNTIKDTVQMNLKPEDIAALVNMQLSHPASWNIYTFSVSGSDATEYAPSLGDKAYVMIPNEEQITQAKQDLQAMKNGEVPLYTTALNS